LLECVAVAVGSRLHLDALLGGEDNARVVERNVGHVRDRHFVGLGQKRAALFGIELNLGLVDQGVEFLVRVARPIAGALALPSNVLYEIYF
jgi:hypothetical protein